MGLVRAEGQGPGMPHLPRIIDIKTRLTAYLIYSSNILAGNLILPEEILEIKKECNINDSVMTSIVENPTFLIFIIKKHYFQICISMWRGPDLYEKLNGSWLT